MGGPSARVRWPRMNWHVCLVAGSVTLSICNDGQAETRKQQTHDHEGHRQRPHCVIAADHDTQQPPPGTCDGYPHDGAPMIGPVVMGGSVGVRGRIGQRTRRG